MSNVGILFEICFVPNCKIGIIEHLQVGLTAASQNYNDNSIFLTNTDWIKTQLVVNSQQRSGDETF